jgi:hypothetical protein
MNNNPNHWLELLSKVKPWKDGIVLTEHSLNEHEAQLVILARLYGAVRWGADCFGLHPAGKLKLTSQLIDNQTWDCQLSEVIAITATGQILIGGACQQTLSSTDGGGLLVAVPIEQPSLPAPLCYQAAIKLYPEPEALALTSKGQAVPIARWLGGAGLDENYIPPTMSLGAHPYLWQQVQAITEGIERILAQSTSPNAWLFTVWVPCGDEKRLMTMPPIEWLSLHLRSLWGLASQEKLRPLIEHLESRRQKELSLFTLTDNVNDIKTAWEIVETRLHEVLTLKIDDKLFKQVQLSIEKTLCNDKSPGLVITIPQALLDTPLLLAIPTQRYQEAPTNLAINLKGPSGSGYNYKSNQKLQFSQQTAVYKQATYWVCKLPRPTTKINDCGILTLVADLPDINQLYFLSM